MNIAGSDMPGTINRRIDFHPFGIRYPGNGWQGALTRDYAGVMEFVAPVFLPVQKNFAISEF